MYACCECLCLTSHRRKTCKLLKCSTIRQLLVVKTGRPINPYIIRPHRSTTYVDTAYCYRPSIVACLSVCRSVCHSSEPCKDGWASPDAVWVVDLGRLKELRVRWGSRSPRAKGQFFGESSCDGMPHDTLPWAGFILVCSWSQFVQL